MIACAPQVVVLKSYKIVNALLPHKPLKVRYMKFDSLISYYALLKNLRAADPLTCPKCPGENGVLRAHGQKKKKKFLSFSVIRSIRLKRNREGVTLLHS